MLAISGGIQAAGGGLLPAVVRKNLQEDYVAALVTAWKQAIEIEGLLLTGGAELAMESSMPSVRNGL